MEYLKSIKTLKNVVIANGIFDLIGGLYFILLVGAEKSITNPPTHPFYAMLIGTFLLAFAYLELMSARNIKKYLLNIGVVLLSRIFYVVLFFGMLIVETDFPTTFMPTAIADMMWAILIILLTILSDQISLKDLFLPTKEV